MAAVNGQQHQVASTHPSLVAGSSENRTEIATQPTIPTPCDGTLEVAGGINSSNNSTTIDSNASIAPAPTNTPAAESETDRVQVESPTLASSSNHNSSESFHTAASLNNTSNDSRSELVRILETNPEDVTIPNEGIVDMEDEVEYENDFLYEDTAEREQQQGEFWEYQRVVAKETIEKYVHERKSVTIGNCQVQKTWTHIGSIKGEEPVDY